MRPILISAPIILLTLFLGGCWHVPAQPPARPPAPPPTDGGSDTATSTTEIDTSDWQTYTNEEYGFGFRYPREWRYVRSGDYSFGSFFQVGENERDYLNVTITDFAKAPIETIDQGEAGAISSKDSLMKYKKFLKEETTSKNIGGIIIASRGIGYNYVGGGFSMGVNSFVGDNLIEFNYGLKIYINEQYIDNSGKINKNSINKKIEELNAGIGFPEELREIALFDTIISTLRPARLLSD